MNFLEKTKQAFNLNEVKELLLGQPPYECLNKYAPVPRGVSTDIATVLTAGIYPLKKSGENVEERLMAALVSISDSTLGIWTIALFIMLENDTCQYEKKILDIDLNELAVFLRNKIIQHKGELFLERS